MKQQRTASIDGVCVACHVSQTDSAGVAELCLTCLFLAKVADNLATVGDCLASRSNQSRSIAS